jgi:alpha-ketoglutarate-dependent taurine dioxygenase
MHLEDSKNKVITKLPVGSSIVANNYFWLHGRKAFKENKSEALSSKKRLILKIKYK